MQHFNSKPAKPKRPFRRSVSPQTPMLGKMDDSSVKHEFMRLFEAGERAKPENTFGDLDRRRILYYPGAGRDFTPLSRLTHLYDTFIYADYGTDNPDFPDLATWILDAVPGKTGLKIEEMKRVPAELLQTLGREPVHSGSPSRHEAWEQAPWGTHVQMTRTIGSVERPIDLFYLCLEGATVYRNLFLKSCTTPRGVCFISTDGFACNHTRFGRWSECLGSLVQQNPRKPEFIMHAHGDYDWPWNSVWQNHSGWSCMHGGTATTFSLPVAMAAYPEMDPHVVVEGGPVRPQSGLQVVVRRGFELLGGVCDIVRGDGVPALGPALKEQVGIAQANHATELHCRLTGFEDEGCVLETLHGTDEHQLTLFIYCQNEGDLASFAPYCSRVESRSKVAPLNPRPR